LQSLLFVFKDSIVVFSIVVFLLNEPPESKQRPYEPKIFVVTILTSFRSRKSVIFK
jgi:hypothetical protein